MSEKNTLNYQKSLVNFLVLFRFIYPVLAVITVFVVYRYKLKYLAATLGFVAAGIFILLALLCWINVNNHIEYDRQSMTVFKLFGKKTINFTDLTAIKDTGKAIVFYTGQKRALKLSGITYDVNDIADLVNVAQSHRVQLEDAEKATIWDKVYDHDKMKPILGVISILNFVYMMLTIIFASKTLIPFFVLSLIVPLFSLGYYIYMLFKREIDVLIAYRLFFFMTLIIPAFILLIAIARVYTIASFRSIIILTFIFFFLIDILYRYLSTFLSLGTDTLMKVYIFFIIFVSLITLNLVLPPVSTTTSTQTVVGVKLQSSKVMLGYIVVTEDAEGNREHFNVSTKEVTKYAVDQKVTVTKSVGPFEMTYATVKPS